jgi:hypothetical protein
VIVNEHPGEYLDETHHALTRLVEEAAVRRLAAEAGRHIPATQRGDGGSDRHLLGAVAAAVLRGDLGEMRSQLQRSAPWVYGEQDLYSRRSKPAFPRPRANR